MELDIKIVVLVALCAAMVQGRDSDPGQSRRELLMKTLNELRSSRYGAMDKVRDYGTRGYGPPPPQPMMKRYPAGPTDVNKAGRDYPPYNPYYKRFPDGQPDNAVPDTTGEPVTESVEATTVSYESEEEETDDLGKTLANLQENLADIESMVVAMVMNTMKERCGTLLPDRAQYDSDVTSQDETGPKFGQLSPVVDNNVAAAQEAIAMSSQIAELLVQIEKCMGVNGGGEFTGETPETNEGQVIDTDGKPVVETTEEPIVQTTEATEETTDELSDGDMEQLKRLLMKKLLEERVSALAKKGYPAGK